ncbi:glycine zipper 2TM domain-containing protein [Oxalobacteraceae bacterium OTU3CINTB1]|nr:glycine zipper 2TM domain-containing protein [Oxalobacteraceae bacterium OTU3CINTB1]
MTTPNTPTKQTLHPLMIIAAVAVVLFCGVGTAAIMGWLPTSNANGSVPGAAPMPGQLASVPPAEQQPAPAYNNGANNGNSLAANNNAGRNADNNASGRDQDRAPEPEVKQAAVCKSCGVVESVRSIEHRPQGSGVGAAGGAILGGLLGNQVGGGHGRQLATVAGAVGGAVAGNQVETHMKTTRTWRIVVRMDNGTTRTFNQSAQPAWGSGDAVRVVNGQLRSAN